MKRLKGKVCLITQAGASFGMVLAQAYAEEGADLYLQDWKDNKEKLEKIARDIRRKTKRKVVTGIYDITKGAATGRMTKDVLKKFGRVDVLVNTAMKGGHGLLFDLREYQWDDCMDVAIKSYFLTCQYIGEEMARVGYGKIINLTSIVGQLGSGGAVPWSAARGGVDSMTYALAHALGEFGIRVVALARGATESTPYTEEAKWERLRRLPFGRLANEEDTIGPAIFLATAESDWVTGSIIYADGGYCHAATTDADTRATEYPLKKRGLKASKTPVVKNWIDTKTR